jgi:hypothetical protein
MPALWDNHIKVYLLTQEFRNEEQVYELSNLLPLKKRTAPLHHGENYRKHDAETLVWTVPKYRSTSEESNVWSRLVCLGPSV